MYDLNIKTICDLSPRVWALPDPPAAMFPYPPHQGGEGGSCVDPSGRSEFPATPSRTPRHLTSPSLGSESGPAMQDGSAVLPANPSLAPRSSAPPLTGRGLRAGGPAGTTSARQLPALQFTAGIGSSSPSWADVVRNGSHLSTSPPATADFLALYDRCSSSGFKTRINISNLAGIQEIILMCQIPTSTASAPRRRRRPRRRGQAVSAAVPSRTSHTPILSAPPSTRPESLPPVPPAPEPSPPKSLPTPSPPQAKRTRKAAKRCCEVELLRGVGVEDDCYVLPLLLTPPPADRHRRRA
jgi:hypothetical protein